jgi:DNA-binding response OmpR family regulator
LKKKSVLIVDDNRMARHTVRKVIEPLNVDIREAQNGEEALRMVNEEKPDLIILDLNMPKVNGPQVFQSVMREYRGLRVILMSAAERTSILDRLSSSWDAGYIVKPIKPDELRTKVSAALRN